MERGVSRVRSRSLTDRATGDESPPRKPLAVFDVDGTLFRRGLLPELTRRLVDEGVFSERVREELSRDYYAWVERRGSYESYDNLVVELFQRELKGIALEELRRCARAEVEDHGRRLHLYTHELTQRLREALPGGPRHRVETNRGKQEPFLVRPLTLRKVRGFD